MFFLGSRVNVYCSSVGNKKLGPRENSKGFVSHCESPNLIGIPAGLINKNGMNVLALPVIIAFYKYGNEVRDRCELRRFIHVLPIFKSPFVTKEVIKDFVKTIKARKFHNPSFFNINIKLNISPNKKFTYGILVPAAFDSICSQDSLKARAWSTAVLNSPYLLSSHLKLKGIKAIVQNPVLGKDELINTMLLASSSKKYRQAFLKATEESPEVVTELQKLVSIFNCRSDKSETDKLISISKNVMNATNRNHLMSWFIKGYMANNKSMIKEREKLLNENISTTEKQYSQIDILRSVAKTLTQP